MAQRGGSSSGLLFLERRRALHHWLARFPRDWRLHNADTTKKRNRILLLALPRPPRPPKTQQHNAIQSIGLQSHLPRCACVNAYAHASARTRASERASERASMRVWRQVHASWSVVPAHVDTHVNTHVDMHADTNHTGTPMHMSVYVFSPS